MYHYTDCGLPNVWLVNGFKVHDTPYGKGVAIENLQGLHECIAIELVYSNKPLNGAEFRFLRLELDMSQRQLGSVFGKTEQTIANWEKRLDKSVPKYADLIMRAMYREHANKNVKITHLIQQLNAEDRARAKRCREKLAFEDIDNRWISAKAKVA